MASIPVLSFEQVSKYRMDGQRRMAVLENASFELDRGACAGIWGARCTGKTTLLRLAAGVELADEGSVMFGGRDVACLLPIERERLLRAEIGFVSPVDWRPRYRERVIDYVALPLLSTGTTLQQAAQGARAALKRVGAGDIREKPARTLSLGERIRVMFARALINEPVLLLVDEPATVPNLVERDQLAQLLSGLASEHCLSMLIASEDMSSLRCADFLMSIGSGEIVRSNERKAEVLAFPAPPAVRLERPAR